MLIPVAVLGATIASICILIIAELVTRATYGKHLEYGVTGDTGWELKPSQKGFAVPGRAKATINSSGFRGREGFPSARRYRILLVGDSFAFGYGVGDNETLSFFLEQKLNSDFGKDVEVLNFGVPGYGVYQMDALVRKRIDEYAPAMVVMEMVKWDVFRQPEQIRRSRLLVGKIRGAIFRKSSLAAVVMPRLEMRRRAWHDAIMGKSTWADEKFRGLWACDSLRINELHKFLRPRNIGLVFVPYISHERAKDFAEFVKKDLDREIVIVDGIYERLKEYSIAQKEKHIHNAFLRIEGDGHPTAASYRIAAGAIAETLIRETLI